MRKFLRWLPVLLLWFAVSCAGVSKYAETAPTQNYVEVVNNGWSDIVVYVVVDGSTSKYRVGDVTSFNHRRFKLNAAYENRSISFVVHPIAGRDWQSEQIGINPQTLMHLTIENAISMSSLWLSNTGSQ